MITAFFIAGSNAAAANEINVLGIGKITGNVRSITSGLSLQDVSVTLYSATDSTMIAGTLSDQFGNFCFSMLSTGKYFIEFSNAGFKTFRTVQLNISTTNPKIILEEIKLHPLTAADKKRRNK